MVEKKTKRYIHNTRTPHMNYCYASLMPMCWALLIWCWYRMTPSCLHHR